MSAAFTPGPWLHSYRKGHDGMNRHKVDENTTTTNRTQNAQLIAAAPDLLEFADTVVAVLEHCQRAGLHLDLDKQQFLKEARRVIAKALPVTTKDAA